MLDCRELLQKAANKNAVLYSQKEWSNYGDLLDFCHQKASNHSNLHLWWEHQEGPPSLDDPLWVSFLSSPPEGAGPPLVFVPWQRHDEPNSSNKGITDRGQGRGETAACVMFYSQALVTHFAVYQPVVPVRGFQTVIFWDVKIIHLPGALVVGKVSPLDQVMHIPILIKTGRTNMNKQGDHSF